MLLSDFGAHTNKAEIMEKFGTPRRKPGTSIAFLLPTYYFVG